MLIKGLQYFISYVAVIFLPAGLYFAVSYFFVVEYQMDEYFFVSLGLLLIVPFGFFVTYMWAYLQEVFLKIVPSPDSSKVDKQQVMEAVVRYFEDANIKSDRALFEIKKDNDSVYLTWSDQIDFNQLLEFGTSSKKLEIEVYFDDKDRKAYLVSRKIEKNVKAGLYGFGGSFSFETGIIFQKSSEYEPSFSIVNGRPQIVIEKIAFSTFDFTKPIENIVPNNGWTLQFSGGPRTFMKILKSVSISMCCISLIFVIIYFINNHETLTQHARETWH